MNGNLSNVWLSEQVNSWFNPKPEGELPSHAGNGRHATRLLAAHFTGRSLLDFTVQSFTNPGAVSIDEFKGVLVDIMAGFINLPAREVDKQVGHALRQVCAILGLDRAQFWRRSPDSGSFILTEPCVAPGGPKAPQWTNGNSGIPVNGSAQAPQVKETPLSIESKVRFPWITAQARQGKTVIFARIEQLPAEAWQDKEALRGCGTRSSVIIPLIVQSEVLGAVGFEMVREERVWTEPLVMKMKLAAEILADVTARKLADEALKASTKELVDLKAALDQHAIVVVADVQGRITSVNDKFCSISKCSREELLGHHHRIINFEHHSKEFFRQLWTTVCRGRIWQGEIKNRTKDGSFYWVATTIVPLLDENGKPRQYVAMGVDITERKKVENVLRESEARFRAVADSAPVLIWMSGTDKLCNFFNKPWLDFTGRTMEQEMGNGWAEGVHSDDLEKCYQTYVTSFDARQPFNMQYRLKRHDGAFRWISDTGVPRYDSDGHFVGYIGSCVDITEQKLAEEALVKSYAEIKQFKDRLKAESDYLKAEIKVAQAHGQIIGRSQGIKRVLHMVEQVAPVDCTVLVNGETGTGKELIAQEIHRLSRRKERHMVLVNCAALPSALVESELFGRERGAYTGALTSQVGRFEVADGSTIFLDEVGELSMDVQAKLLRVLQQGEFQRLGSPKTHKVNVRVISATNRDLAEEVRKGKFREDLYYRLKVFPIAIPPLRERIEDIPLLAFAFMEEFSCRMGKKITKVPRNAMQALQEHSWPGNIRELRNVIEHSVILSSGEMLKLSFLGDSPTRDAQRLTLAEAEREHILKTLESTGWRIKGPHGAAQRLDLQPSTLYSRMQKLAIPHRRQKDEMPTKGLTCAA